MPALFAMDAGGAVIFDCDGTLVDSEPLSGETWRRVVGRYGYEIADADLWLPSSKQAVADNLLEALNERASAVVVGEPGVGKTCVLRATRHRVAAAGYRLTYSHNATLGRRNFAHLIWCSRC